MDSRSLCCNLLGLSHRGHPEDGVLESVTGAAVGLAETARVPPELPQWPEQRYTGQRDELDPAVTERDVDQPLHDQGKAVGSVLRSGRVMVDDKPGALPDIAGHDLLRDHARGDRVERA